MHIAIGIPQREDRITIALLHRANLITLHGRVLSVDILQDIWVDKDVIKSCIEDRALCLCTTLNEDAREVIIPLSTRLSTNNVEVLSTLFGIKVLTSVCHTYEWHTHLHLYLLISLSVEVHPYSDIITREFLVIGLIELELAIVGIPLSLYACHRTLFLPIASLCWLLTDTHHEVNWEYSLRVITECTLQLHTLILCVAHLLHHGTRLICESFTEVQQDMTFSFRECETCNRTAKSGCYLCLHIILFQIIRIITGVCNLLFVCTSVLLIINVQLSCRRHKQQWAYFWTTHTTQIDVRIAREKDVMIFVRSWPPACILVIFIQIGTHYVEWYDWHQSVRAYCSRIGCTKIRCSDKRIDKVNRLFPTFISRLQREERQGKK